MGKELELYLHIPYCVKKCAYCDFLSGPGKEEDMLLYGKALCAEIRQQAAICKDAQVSSLFIGGGTPSVFPIKAMAEVMDTLYEAFSFAQNAELSIECNPGTLNEEKVKAYATMGFNRMSFGLQSAVEDELKLLGRIHSYGDFLKNYELVRRIGFQNVNVDLMSGLPGQSTKDFEKTLKQIIRLHPEHISAYGLIVEEGTPFFEIYGDDEERREKGEDPLLLPTEETEREMYHMTEELLQSFGYHHYEISNYAKPGKECQHNIGYWIRKPYLGLGLGAASLLEEKRFQNTTNMENYLEGVYEREPQQLTQREQMEEFMFLGLRMMEGVSRGDFFDAFHFDIQQVYGKELLDLKKQGLLEEKDGRVFLTESGIDVSNYVFSKFLD